MTGADLVAARRARRHAPRVGGRFGRDAQVVALALVLAVLLAGLVAYGLTPIALALVVLPAIIVGVVALAASPSRATLTLVALLCVHPSLRLSLGPVPLYALDGLIVVALIAYLRSRPPLPAFGLFVIAYVGAWLPAWVLQLAGTELFLEPTYALIRNALAVSVFFLGYWAFTSQNRTRILTVIAAGMIFTSIVAVLQAAPGTKEIIRSVFETVAPSSTAGGYRVYPDRSFALFFAPTALSGFLGVAGLVLAVAATQMRGRPRRILLIAAAAAGPALIATYSRQWLPALVVGIFVLAACRPQLGLRAVAAMTVAGVLALGALGAGLLDSAYLGERYSRLSTRDPNVQARLDAQKAFFESLDVTEARAFFGRGLGVRDLIDRRLIPTLEAQRLRRNASENAYYYVVFERGIIAGLIYLGLLVAALVGGAKTARRGGPSAALAAGLTAALATAIVLHWLDPYFGDSMFMQAFLWLIVGMVVAVTHSAATEATDAPAASRTAPRPTLRSPPR